MKRMTKILHNIKYIIFIFLGLCFIELWPLLGIRTETQLIGAIPDEYKFMDCILQLRNFLLNGSFKEVLGFGTPYGYGYVYWLFMGIIGLPIAFLQYSDLVLFYRLIGLLFKAIALFYLYKGISYKVSQRQGILSVILILCMPGFWFYGKVISPEYIILGLISISLYLLVLDNLEIKKYYYLSVVIFALAVSIKLIILPFGIIYPIYLLLKREKKTILHFVTTPFIIVLLFFLSNLTLITKSGRNVFHIWMNINGANIYPPSLRRIAVYYMFDNITWDQIINSGFMIDYLNAFLFLAFVGILAFSIYRKNRCILIIPFAISDFILTVIIMSTQPYHSWYLMVPLLSFVYFIFLTDNKDKLIQQLLIVMILLTFITNIPRIIYKYNYRMQINQVSEVNYENGFIVQDFILQNYEGGTILANPFLALPVFNINNVKIIRDEYIPLYVEQGDNGFLKKFPDTEWLYLKNEVNFEGFILIKKFPIGYLYKKE
jgi:hypothetical protein